VHCHASSPINSAGFTAEKTRRGKGRRRWLAAGCSRLIESTGNLDWKFVGLSRADSILFLFLFIFFLFFIFFFDGTEAPRSHESAALAAEKKKKKENDWNRAKLRTFALCNRRD